LLCSVNKILTEHSNNAINYEITFLAFGESPKSKNLTFSLNDDHQLVVKFTPGEVNPRDIDGKRYYLDRTVHYEKIVTQTKFKRNKDYFIDFAFFKYAQLSETQLFINCKRESSLSFSNRPIIRFNKVVFGSEVHSFPFEGVISDCAVVYNFDFNEMKKSSWVNKLYRYYTNYCNEEPGKRLDCLEVDCD